MALQALAQGAKYATAIATITAARRSILNDLNPRSKKYRKTSKPNQPRRTGLLENLHLRQTPRRRRFERNRLRLFHLYNPRQPMQIDRDAHPLSHTMPRRRGYGKRRTKRRGRPRYKRRVKKRRGRRMRKRRISRPRLRLYPGGFPLTHKIKLRMVKQIVIHTNAAGGQWGWFKWNPARLSDPLSGLTAGGVVGTHVSMNVTLKDGAAITPRPQPYGYDHWLGDTTTSTDKYKRYSVLGSKCTLVKTSDTVITDAAASRFYAGWSRLFSEDGAATTGFGLTFAQTYIQIGFADVSDWLNTGVVKHPGVITNGKVFNKADPAFTATYSQKKYKRSLERRGFNQAADWSAIFSANPGIDPEFHFMIADLGAATTTVPMRFLMVCDYTVLLSSGVMGEHSNV